MTGYIVAVWAHVLAALVWLGGMFFFALVAPVLRRVEDEAVRARIFDELGRRFRIVGWICVAVLLVTGVEQLRFNGYLSPELWALPEFWRSSRGAALAWKLGTVVTMLAVQAAHDFWLGPAAGRAAAGTERARALRVGASWLGRLNALVGVLLVFFAVRLARGG